MTETPQQELERRRREDDERQRAAAAAQAPGAGFNISDLWSWIPNLSTIFMGLAVVTGLYFVAKMPAVQNWIGETFGPEWKQKLQNLIGATNETLGKVAGAVGLGGMVNEYAANKPIDEIQATLRDNGAPAAVVNALAADAATWKANVDAIQAEGGNVADPISATNIYAMLTRRPQTVQQMMAAIKPGATLTDAQKVFAQKLSGAVSDLVKSDKLDALLTTHRDTVLPLLLQFSPVPVDSAKFSTALQRIAFGQDGKVTAPFRELLTGLMQQTDDVNADNAARMAALKKFFTDAHVDGTSLKLFAQSIDVSHMADSPLKTLIVKAQQSSPRMLQAEAQLAAGAVPLSTLQELQQLAASSPTRLTDRLMNDAGLRQQMIDDHTITKLGQLLQVQHDESKNASERSMLSVLITHPRNQQQNYVNLNAMFTLVDDLANNPRNIAPNGRIGAQPSRVLHAMMDVVNAKNPTELQAAFAKFNTAETVQFFSNPANSAAFGKFFRNFNTAFLPTDVRAKVNALRDHFGSIVIENGQINHEKSTGFAEILADPKAVAYLLEQMKQPQAQQTQQSEGWLRFKMGSASWLGGMLGVPDLGTIPENADAVVAMMKASGQVAPAPTPARIRANGLGIYG